MEYLLKVSAIVVVFYLCYKLFLQRTTFFNENRWFLLAGLVTAFSFPFIVIPMYIESVPMVFSELVTETNLEPIINTTPIVVQETEKPFNILDYLPIIYGLGVLFFGVKFIIQMMSLSILVLKNKRRKESGFTFIEIASNQSPFSFFNWIIYNPNNFLKTELQQILTHEKIHANQKHSIDVLLAQISCILLWFNPFIWLYSKAIKQNLEFIADLHTQEKLGCSSTYQKTLLKVCVSANQLSISNNFYSSFIKKRIVMLNKSKSKKVNLIKFAIVLPLLGIFLMNFNTKEVYVENESNFKNQNLISENKPEEFIIYNYYSDEKMQEFKTELENKGFDFNLKEIKRNKRNQITSIEFTIDKNGAKGEYGMYSGQPLKTIVIHYSEANKKISIKTLEFINNEKLIDKSKNVVEIVIEGNKNVAALEKQKIDLKEKYDIDFTFEVIEKSSENEFAHLSFAFNNGIRGIGPISGAGFKDKVVVKYDTKTKLFTSQIIKENGDFGAGISLLLDIPEGYLISKDYADKTFKIIVDGLKKDGVIAKFTNIKRNDKNEITAIAISAKYKKGKVYNFNIDSKEPIGDILINYFKNSKIIKFHNSKVKKYGEIGKNSDIEIKINNKN